ncbi:hypothetical protein Tco_0534542 [Tanacetum coccineum]
MHESNFDQLYAYLRQHEVHANEVKITRERFPEPLALVANYHHTPSNYNNHQYQYNPSQYQQQLSPFSQQLYTPHQQPLSYKALAHQQAYQSLIIHQTSMISQQAYQSPTVQQQPQAMFTQPNSRLAVSSFLPGDDPIASLNKTMTFMSTSITSRYPPTNNQLRKSYNLRNQATILDGVVTVQQVQGRQSQSFAGSGSQSNTNSTRGNRNEGTNAANQIRVICCYNFCCEGHMARQCTQPKRPRNADWFKEKILLIQAHESGVVLDEEQLAFLANLGTDDLDAFDSNYDEAPSSRAMLMANLSSYDSDVLLDVPISDNFQDNSLLDHNVPDHTFDIEITSDSNIITYDQYMKDTESEVIQDTTAPEQQNDMIMYVIEEMSNQEKQKKAPDNIVYKVGQYAQTMHMWTKPQAFYDETYKTALGYQNPFYLRKAQRIKPTLYNGSVLVKPHDVISVFDSEETLILAEDS